MRSSIRLNLNWSYSAVLIFVCFITINILSGLIVFPHADMHQIQLRDIGAALCLPFIGGIVYFILPFVSSIARQEVLKNAQICSLSASESNAVANKVCEIPIKLFIFGILVGFAVMFSYLYTEGLFYVDAFGPEGNLKRYPLVVQAWWMWTGICFTLLVMLRNTKIFDQFILEHLTVELFRRTHTFPFSRAIFWNALFFSIVLSFVPLLWIGSEPHFKDFLIAMAVLLLIINLTFYPLLRVRQIKSSAFESLKSANHYDWELSEAPVNRSFEKLTPRDRELILSDVRNMQNSHPKKWTNVFHLVLRVTIVITIPILTWTGLQLLSKSLIYF